MAAEDFHEPAREPWHRGAMPHGPAAADQVRELRDCRCEL